MGDLEDDTRVEPTGDRDGRYRAKLSPDWAIWGPNGGYVVAVALRAAGVALGRARPASIVAHILGVAAFDEVDLDVTLLRTSRYASSARVSMRQGDRPIVEALVWGLDPGGAALEHDAAPPPARARPGGASRPAPSGWPRSPRARAHPRSHSSTTSTCTRSAGSRTGPRPAPSTP